MTLVGEGGVKPDKEKIRRLYEEHGRGLIAFACSVVNGFAAAEDVLHEVFRRILRGGIDMDALSVPYLYRAVRNEALNHVRNRSRDTTLEDSWLEAPTDNDDEATLMLQSVLRTLPEEQREIIILRVWGQLSFDEAAATLNISPKTAASRYRYGVEKLRAQFDVSPGLRKG
jgi:RNA polymerase sigma-70 factor (ECF subfamily)